MNRYILVILCAVFLLHASAPSIGAAKPKEPLLRVGYNSSLPPYEYEEGQLAKGFSVGLMENFAQKRGYVIKWVPMNYEDIVDAVLTNKVDLAVGVAFSEALLSKVEFSSSYLTVTTVIACSRKSGIYEPEQLALKRVVVTSGMNRQYHIDSLAIGDADRYLNTVKALASVNEHLFDATLVPDATVAYCELKKKMSSLSTIPLPLSQSTVCVIGRRGQHLLIQSINDAIQSMHADGSYAKCEAQWLSPFIPQSDDHELLWWQLVLVLATGLAVGGLAVYKFRRLPVPAPVPPSLEQLGVAGGSEGIWLLELETGTIRANQTLLRMFSLPLEPESLMLATFMRYIPQSYRRLVSECIADCANKKRDGYMLVHPINTIDGEVRWVSIYASVVASDDEGTPTTVAGTCRDVTEMVIKQHELETQNEYYDSLMNSIHNVVLLLDAHLSVLRCNAHTERVLGIRRDRIIGLNFISTFIPKARQDDLRSRFILLLISKGSASIEENLVTSSGQIRRFRWSICKMTGANKVLQWALVGDDITGQIVQERRPVASDQVADIKAHLYRQLAQHADIRVIGQAMADAFVDSCRYDAVWVGSYDSKSSVWTALAAQVSDATAGFTIHAVEKWGLLNAESPLSLACNTQQFYQLSQLSTNRINEAWWNHLAAHGIETIIVQPLVWRDRLVGVVLGMRKAAVPLELEQQIYLSEIADAICFGLVLSDMNELLP